MYKIFLSHAHADLARASAIYRRLLALGQTVWMDESPLDPESSHGFVGIPAGQPHREEHARDDEDKSDRIQHHCHPFCPHHGPERDLRQG